MSEGSHILVIDDDTLFLEIAKFNLEKHHHVVQATADPKEGLNLAIENSFDLILLDLKMPGLNGNEVLSLLKPMGRQQRVLVVSGQTSQENEARARDLGAIGYLRKPVNSVELCRVVDDLLEDRSSFTQPESEGLSQHPLDCLARWVFDRESVFSGSRAAALGIILGLSGVLVWLVWLEYSSW